MFLAPRTWAPATLISWLWRRQQAIIGSALRVRIEGMTPKKVPPPKFGPIMPAVSQSITSACSLGPSSPRPTHWVSVNGGANFAPKDLSDRSAGKPKRAHASRHVISRCATAKRPRHCSNILDNLPFASNRFHDIALNIHPHSVCYIESVHVLAIRMPETARTGSGPEVSVHTLMMLDRWAGHPEIPTTAPIWIAMPHLPFGFNFPLSQKRPTPEFKRGADSSRASSARTASIFSTV